MKKIFRKIIPDSFIIKYKEYKSRNSKFQDKNITEIFTSIYKENHWEDNESISGPGSNIIQTRILVENLNNLLKKMNIHSILDIPCGDFNWMQNVDLNGINYLGADIVEELITENKSKFEKPNIKFEVLDLIHDTLPQSDLIIVRDCLVHLSFENIYKSLQNIKSSGSGYLLTTTFTDYSPNYDIPTGEWRALNLQSKPFRFPKPVLIINEKSSEQEGQYNDKSMALWKIKDL